MKQSYLKAVALLGWFALGLQFCLMVVRFEAHGGSVLEAVFRFFNFFTILTNIGVALVLTFSAWPSSSRMGRFFAQSMVQSGAAVFIFLVGVIYFLLLRQLWNPQGAQWLADVMLHYAMPALYLAFWFLWVRKGSLQWSDALAWLIYPLLYLVWMFLRGTLAGFYPYPFLDPSAEGYARVLINAALLFAVCLGLGLSVVAIGRRMEKRESL